MATGQWGGALSQRVFRVNVAWTMAQQKCQTGFHLRDVGVNTLDPSDVADEVGEWASTQFIKVLHSADRLVGVDAVNLVTKEGAQVNFNNLAGTQTGKQLPTSTMVALSIKGGIRRRYANGRMLWPVRGELIWDGNELSALGVTQFNTVINDLLSRYTGPAITTSMQLVHLHEEIAATSAHPVVPPTWYDADSIRLNTLISNIKRRKVGVGS